MTFRKIWVDRLQDLGVPWYFDILPHVIIKRS